MLGKFGRSRKGPGRPGSAINGRARELYRSTCMTERKDGSGDVEVLEGSGRVGMSLLRE
jgi:hypothetical protein